jgi:hypothetical protein
MLINKKTKQHIFDELKSRDVDWSGKLDEADFLTRILDIAELPSNDPRFDNMKSDHWQHRVNNDDWDYYWIFIDERINLLNDDDLFKKFVCELMHPAVRKAKETKLLRDMFNYYLKKDGYQIIEDEQYYEPGVNTYKFAEINPTQVEKGFKTTDDFVHEAYEKIDKRLRDEDYSGAITSARTLLEYAIKDIYYQITGDNIGKINDLQEGFKKIQELLNLDYDKATDQSKKTLLRSYVTIVNSLTPLFNSLGDRHATKSIALRNSAQFCTDSVKIFVNFIYGRMQDIHGIYPSIYKKLIKMLDSGLRLKKKEVLITNKDISKTLVYCDDYLSALLIKNHISEFEIDSFRKSDIFFAFLRIFSSSIQKTHLLNIIEKHKDNTQAVGLEAFLVALHKEHNKLFTKKIKTAISNCSYVESDAKEYETLSK